MAKKKAQHLYELLQQRAMGKPAQPGSEPAGPATVPQAAAARGRKHVSADPKSVSPPVPVNVGQEHLLENVITIRRDTAIVGSLLIVVVIIVSFFVGRLTVSAPDQDDTGGRPAVESSEPTGSADDQENPSTGQGR